MRDTLVNITSEITLFIITIQHFNIASSNQIDEITKTIQRLAKSMRPKDRDFSESETVDKCMLRY